MRKKIAWVKYSAEELIGQLVEKYNLKDVELRKETKYNGHFWFDSGVSHDCAKTRGRMYTTSRSILRRVQIHKEWFQTWLLTSMINS